MFRTLKILLDNNVKEYYSIIKNIEKLYNIKIYIFVFNEFSDLNINNIDLVISNKLIKTYLPLILVEKYDLENKKFINLLLDHIDNYNNIKQISNDFLLKPPLIINTSIFKDFNQNQILENIKQEVFLLTNTSQYTINSLDDSFCLSFNTEKEIKKTDLFYTWKLAKNIVISNNQIDIYI